MVKSAKGSKNPRTNEPQNKIINTASTPYWDEEYAFEEDQQQQQYHDLFGIEPEHQVRPIRIFQTPEDAIYAITNAYHRIKKRRETLSQDAASELVSVLPSLVPLTFPSDLTTTAIASTIIFSVASGDIALTLGKQRNLQLETLDKLEKIHKEFTSQKYNNDIIKKLKRLEKAMVRADIDIDITPSDEERVIEAFDNLTQHKTSTQVRHEAARNKRPIKDRLNTSFKKSFEKENFTYKTMKKVANDAYFSDVWIHIWSVMNYPDVAAKKATNKAAKITKKTSNAIIAPVKDLLKTSWDHSTSPIKFVKAMGSGIKYRTVSPLYKSRISKNAGKTHTKLYNRQGNTLLLSSAAVLSGIGLTGDAILTAAHTAINGSANLGWELATIPCVLLSTTGSFAANYSLSGQQKLTFKKLTKVDDDKTAIKLAAESPAITRLASNFKNATQTTFESRPVSWIKSVWCQELETHDHMLNQMGAEQLAQKRINDEQAFGNALQDKNKTPAGCLNQETHTPEELDGPA